MNLAEPPPAAAPRLQGRSGEASGPSGALVAALTTEHYTLQSSRASTVVEANGRGQLFLSAVSGATIAVALVAQLDHDGETFLVFALAVLPALLMLGLMTYSRLADLAVHDAYYARAIGRIRAFYFDLADDDARRYWLLAAGDDPQAVMRHAGQRMTRWHYWTHQATAVAVVTAVLAGVLAGVAAQASTGVQLSWSAGGGTAVAAVVLAALLKDQQRRWRRSAQRSPSLFATDGTRQERPVPAVCGA